MPSEANVDPSSASSTASSEKRLPPASPPAPPPVRAARLCRRRGDPRAAHGPGHPAHAAGRPDAFPPGQQLVARVQPARWHPRCARAAPAPGPPLRRSHRAPRPAVPRCRARPAVAPRRPPAHAGRPRPRPAWTRAPARPGRHQLAAVDIGQVVQAQLAQGGQTIGLSRRPCIAISAWRANTSSSSAWRFQPAQQSLQMSSASASPPGMPATTRARDRPRVRPDCPTIVRTGPPDARPSQRCTSVS